MNYGRQGRDRIGANVKLLGLVGLTTAMAIAMVGSGLGRAEAQSNPSLPRVESGTTAPTSLPSTSSPSNSTAAVIQDGENESNRATTTASTRFFCQLWNGQYTVMYSPEDRANESFPWAVPKDLGNGWVAEKRCNEISRRLEEYRPDGLRELSTSTENGYNIVCATTQSDPTCRIVFTVPPGQDPLVTRNSVFQNLTIADSGTMTQGVNTFVGSGQENLNLTENLVNLGLSVLGRNAGWRSSYVSQSINLRPYLSPADGGTGQALGQGIRRQKSLRLNPEKFR